MLDYKKLANDLIDWICETRDPNDCIELLKKMGYSRDELIYLGFDAIDIDALTTYKEGMTIKIIYMEGEPQYTGKTGTIEHIDDMGQLHGTWGGCALIPGNDDFIII